MPAWLHDRNHPWDHTLLSDEKRFYLFAPGNRKNDVVWARDASTVPVRPRSTCGVASLGMAKRR